MTHKVRLIVREAWHCPLCLVRGLMSHLGIRARSCHLNLWALGLTNTTANSTAWLWIFKILGRGFSQSYHM